MFFIHNFHIILIYWIEENMANKSVLGASKIGARGQVTIPKNAREDFGLKTGDIVLFVKDGNSLVIRKGL